MEVIHSIFVPLFSYYYSTTFSTVKVRVLKVCEQSLHILLTRQVAQPDVLFVPQIDGRIIFNCQQTEFAADIDLCDNPSIINIEMGVLCGIALGKR